jgi:seryl-tRNA synthetase
MTVKELKKIITDKGLTAKTKGFIEKREFIELLRGTRKSKSPTSKKVDSNRGDTRKSKSPSRNKTIKIDRDEKKLQELFQTHEDLQQSINELETLLGKLTEHKDTDNASQVNNELKRQKLELKQIEKKIHKITGTEFSLLYEISRLFSRLTLRK